MRNHLNAKLDFKSVCCLSDYIPNGTMSSNVATAACGIRFIELTLLNLFSELNTSIFFQL
ncbi:MAG: hypothetical protein GF329_08655 [Candidatus Lokiarchaeota archaeon]|nr:hypothetical protein [Candidatus Lokiarchaeota archaeon]